MTMRIAATRGSTLSIETAVTLLESGKADGDTIALCNPILNGVGPCSLLIRRRIARRLASMTPLGAPAFLTTDRGRTFLRLVTRIVAVGACDADNGGIGHG